jgi:hypothetical protein
MQARYYDPLIGRFLSIDPVGFSPAQPFMFGRYTYVGNDPVNAIDPFGLKSTLICRSVLWFGKHCFIVVTNDDGTERARFSYGPQYDGDGDSGMLVDVTGSSESETNNDDIEAANNTTDPEPINLNDEGFTDDKIVSAGEDVNDLLGSVQTLEIRFTDGIPWVKRAMQTVTALLHVYRK